MGTPPPDEDAVARILRRFDHLVLDPQTVVVVYVCPLCGNKCRTDGAGLEPVCTGPHPSLDEHPHEPMVRIG